jgi:hypothetical protein
MKKYTGLLSASTYYIIDKLFPEKKDNGFKDMDYPMREGDEFIGKTILPYCFLVVQLLPLMKK